MKKALALILVLLISIMGFAACSSKTTEEVKDTEKTAESTEEQAPADKEDTPEATEEPAEKPVLNIGTLKGPTGMGMAYLMEMDSEGNSMVDYNFDILGAPDQLIGKIVKGEVDIAAVPSNLAAILNTKTKGNIQLLGVNTLGVLYIMENGDSITSLKDLEGKKIYSSGKGGAPEYIINYLLEKNDIKNVEVEYKLEHSEIAAGLASGEMDIAVVPQPFVTIVGAKNKDVKIAIDVTKEWEKLSESGSKLPMGAFIVRKDFAKDNKEAIDKFLEEYKASIEYVNNDPAKAGELIAKYEIFPNAKIATAAIPKCNIVFMDSKESKDHILNFYEVLKSHNPKTIGGAIPDEDFFY